MMKSGRVSCVRHVAHMLLTGKSKWKGPLGRHRHRWEDIIKMDLERNTMRIQLDQDKDPWQTLVTMVMDHRVP
jgi:hypothetical protein